MTKDELYQLVDKIPEERWEDAKRLLENLIQLEEYRSRLPVVDPPVPGNKLEDLEKFAGTFDKEDLEEMKKAIERSRPPHFCG